MPLVLPGCDLLLGDGQTPTAVALGSHGLDGGAALSPLVERHEARDRIVAAGDDELLAGFDAGEEFGEVGFGFADLDCFNHETLARVPEVRGPAPPGDKLHHTGLDAPWSTSWLSGRYRSRCSARRSRTPSVMSS